MARAVDLSAFENVRSMADYDKAALEEARQRHIQAQQLDLQRQAAQRQNDMFELEKQKFEAEKAMPDQMFGGNSFQAQLGNQMKRMGMSDEQIVQALTMKGIPLQNGGYATYSPYDVTGGAPNTGSKAPEPLQGPANQSAPAGRGMNGPPDIDAIKNEVGNIMEGRGPTRTIVEPSMKLEEMADRKNAISKAQSSVDLGLKTISGLLDEQGNLRDYAKSSVGGVAGMQGRLASMLPVSENQRKTQPIIEQLKGGAFLTAFEQMKGAGAITEVEGQKATQAIARLQQYQSEADFQNALKDLQQIVMDAQDRINKQQQVLGSGAQQQMQQPKAQEPQVLNWEDLK